MCMTWASMQWSVLHELRVTACGYRTVRLGWYRSSEDYWLTHGMDLESVPVALSAGCRNAMTLPDLAPYGNEMLRPRADDFNGWVELLADPLRAKHAYWHLVLSGDPARGAIRVGVRNGNADVRMYCAKALDHLVDEESFPELVSLLDDSDDRVRVDALRALACDRCKDTLCRPEKAEVLNKAISLLRSDPSPRVRQMACEVVARWVHTDADAERALLEARDRDEHPSVRKKAGCYSLGGTIHRKTTPQSDS